MISKILLISLTYLTRSSSLVSTAYSKMVSKALLHGITGILVHRQPGLLKQGVRKENLTKWVQTPQRSSQKKHLMPTGSAEIVPVPGKMLIHHKSFRTGSSNIHSGYWKCKVNILSFLKNVRAFVIRCK